jgi:multiple sugar transport system ATP-binding protein
MAEIVIRNLRKEFGSFTAVQGLVLHHQGRRVLHAARPLRLRQDHDLRMIAGLELPTSGEILIDGEDVSQKPASQRDIAMVFQMFALYPHMNVRKNIAYPLCQPRRPQGRGAAQGGRGRPILRIDHMLDKAPSAACPAATASASPWAAPSCATPRPS